MWNKRKTPLLVVLATLLMISLSSLIVWAAPYGGTYVIPIRGDIDNGNLLFVQRAYSEALSGGAEAIVFEIDTYGGSIDSAINIKDIIMSSQVPTVCFVTNKAISAGSLIALAGEQMAMRPGSTIGAAEPRVGSQKADEKTLSMWSAQLSSVAEARGRDGKIAAAMADSDIVIEGLIEKGKLLTLSDSQALAYKMTDAVLESRQEVIDHFALPASSVTVIDQTYRERVVQWLSSPYVAAVLLTLGMAGLIIELLTAGSFGIFGSIGLLSFILYFTGNIWAGNAGIGTVLLFVAGIFLIIMEIFVVPGFGVPGVLGILSIIGSIFFASPSVSYALTSLLTALVATVVLVAVSIKNKKTRKIWKKIILSQKEETQGGYVAPDVSLASYLGAKGRALTILRPAGTGEFGGKRVDVVTLGEFIGMGKEIEVIAVEGGRVIVGEIKNVSDENKVE